MPDGTILIADDDSAIRTVLNQALGRAGYTVRTTGTAAGLWRWVSAGDGRAKFHAGTITCGERDLATGFGQRVGGVAHQIEEHLNQLVAIAQNARQRWVE